MTAHLNSTPKACSPTQPVLDSPPRESPLNHRPWREDSELRIKFSDGAPESAHKRRGNRPAAGSDHSERQHRVRDFLEAGDIGAAHVVDVPAFLGPISEAAVVDAVHDLAQHDLQLRFLPAAAL